jgi:hypothetical protein
MKSWQKNLMLAIAAFILFYIPVEYTWRNVLMYFPIKQHEQLGRLKSLAQVSKRSVIPENYTLIIGDSHAEGLGDWLMKEINFGNPKFNAAHVLHEMSGDDVISFGYRGGYPSDSIAYQTTREFFGLNKYWGNSVPQPKRVLIYFIEGNDTADELASFERMGINWKQLENLDFLRSVVNKRGEDGVKAAGRRWNLLRNAHLIDTGTKLAKLVTKNIFDRGIPAFSPDDRWIRSYASSRVYHENWERYEKSTTLIWAGGKIIKYPDKTVESLAFLTAQQIQWGANMFQVSLEYLTRLFPNAEIWAVYLPSAMNSYQFISETIALNDKYYSESKRERRNLTQFKISSVLETSNRSCRATRRAAFNAGVKFIDTRQSLRNHTIRKGYLHGPNDPSHFNEKGYRTLASIFHRALKGEFLASCKVPDTIEKKGN